MVSVRLIEHAQYHVKVIVDLAVQPWNLYDDTVMRKTLHERVWQSLGYDIFIIIVGFVIDVQNGFLNISHFVPQQVYCHHGERVVALHVLWIAVLHSQILAEPQRLCFYPCLLQLHKNQPLPAVCLPDGGAEVNAEHREVLALVIAVLVRTHLHVCHFLLQQCRQDGAGNALVFHQIFEYYVVYRVCYYHIINNVGSIYWQNYEK